MAVNMQEIASYDGERPQRIRGYAWVIFALTFGLLLSDYMSRQVLSAVFPQIKAELGAVRRSARSAQRHCLAGGWHPGVPHLAGRRPMGSCTQRDHHGGDLEHRDLAVRPVAQLLHVAVGALSGRCRRSRLRQRWHGHSHQHVSRTAHLHGSWRTFAGGMVGSVMGIGFGGSLASHFGWRSAFVGMAVFGIALTVLYMMVAQSGADRRGERPINRHQAN